MANTILDNFEGWQSVELFSLKYHDVTSSVKRNRDRIRPVQL